MLYTYLSTKAAVVLRMLLRYFFTMRGGHMPKYSGNCRWWRVGALLGMSLFLLPVCGVEEDSTPDATEEMQQLPPTFEEKLEKLLGFAELNPLAELQAKELSIAPKEENEVEETPLQVSYVEEVREEEEEVPSPPDKQAQNLYRGKGIAEEMCVIRHQVARNNLYIKLAQLCRRCDACRCYKHSSVVYHRVFQGGHWWNNRYQRLERNRSCTHSLEGEIESLQGNYFNSLSVSYELPHSMERLVPINVDVNRYRRENKQLMARYEKLNTKLRKLGFGYEDFGLDDKADTARVRSPNAR